MSASLARPEFTVRIIVAKLLFNFQVAGVVRALPSLVIFKLLNITLVIFKLLNITSPIVISHGSEVI